MATYSELMAQAQALMNQAEQARKNELSATIADIKAKMKQYGITVADLGGTAGGVKKPSKSKAAAKYKGPNGELWAGGPGPQARVGARCARLGQEHRRFPYLTRQDGVHKGTLGCLCVFWRRR